MWRLTCLLLVLTVVVHEGNSRLPGAQYLKLATSVAQRAGNGKSAWSAKANNAIARMEKALGTEKPERKEAVGGAIKAVGGGSLKLVDGIQNQDWATITAGVLDIIGGFVALAVPYGPIASAVLSVISSILGLFGKKPKSTAEIMKEQLREQEDRDLTAKVTSLLRMIDSKKAELQAYRDDLEENKRNPKLLRNIAGEVKRAQSQMSSLGDEVYGKFKQKKSDYCSSSDKNSDTLPKCIKFIKLYCDLSIARQFLLTDMAGILQDARVHWLARSLRSRLGKIQKDDRNFLLFLANPYQASESQVVAAVLWENRDVYQSTFEYISKLDEMTEKGEHFFSGNVLFCNDAYLDGDCTAEGANIPNLKAWSKDIVSVFIPPGLRLDTFGKQNFKDPCGGFVGPRVLHAIYWPKRAKSVKITKVDRKKVNALKMFRMCDTWGGKGELADDYDSKYVSFVCDTLNYGNYPDLSTARPYTYSWADTINRVYVPPGMEVTAFTGKNYQGDKVGPFYGPYFSNPVCKENKWKSLKIKKTKITSTRMVLISDAKPKVQIEPPAAIVVQIKVCGTARNVTNEHAKHPIKYQGCDWGIFQYMSIPNGFTVNGAAGSREYNNLKGVMTWKKVPGAGKWTSIYIKAKC